jgi:hypothetical protein
MFEGFPQKTIDNDDAGMSPLVAELRLYCWRFGVRRGHLILGRPPQIRSLGALAAICGGRSRSRHRGGASFQSNIRKRRYRHSGPSFRSDACSDKGSGLGARAAKVKSGHERIGVNRPIMTYIDRFVVCPNGCRWRSGSRPVNHAMPRRSARVFRASGNRIQLHRSRCPRRALLWLDATDAM